MKPSLQGSRAPVCKIDHHHRAITSEPKPKTQISKLSLCQSKKNTSINLMNKISIHYCQG